MVYQFTGGRWGGPVLDEGFGAKVGPFWTRVSNSLRPAGKRITQGDDVARMADEIAGRVNASILSVFHESWELYIKRLYAGMLFSLRCEVSPPERAGFHKATPKWRTYRNTPAYFRDYAQWSCTAIAGSARRLPSTPGLGRNA